MQVWLVYDSRYNYYSLWKTWHAWVLYRLSLCEWATYKFTVTFNYSTYFPHVNLMLYTCRCLSLFSISKRNCGKMWLLGLKIMISGRCNRIIRNCHFYSCSGDLCWFFPVSTWFCAYEICTENYECSQSVTVCMCGCLKSGIRSGRVHSDRS